MVLNKASKVPVKKENTDLVTKQQVWLHLIAHFCRVSIMHEALTKYQMERKLENEKFLMKAAANKIVRWYRYYKLLQRMRKHSDLVTKIRIRVAVYIRKQRVKKCKSAMVLITHFIKCVTGSASRTEKLYRFRGRVIRIQRVYRTFFLCTRARLKLMFLALQREMHIARLERNRSQLHREKKSVRSMKKTLFFGDAVQKLDDICNNLTVMIAQRNRVNNLKIKQFRELMNEAEKPVEIKRVLSRGRGGGYCESQFEDVLRRILRNQRRRHILNLKDMERAEASRVLLRHAVDPVEVKKFLKNNYHTGPLNYVLELQQMKRFQSHPLILLTAGGVRELRSVARHIVAGEDEETMNYEIQRVLHGEYDSQDF